MKDLHSPRWMWAKAILFLLIGLAAAALIVIETLSWKVAVLFVLSAWAFCRAYYFAFYVIEHYVDPGFKFSGLISFVRYVTRKKEPQ